MPEFDQFESFYFNRSAFSFFVKKELESKSSVMNEGDSVKYLEKVAQKWLRLDEADKEEYESLLKKHKKDIKKNVKKFLQVRSMSG